MPCVVDVNAALGALDSRGREVDAEALIQTMDHYRVDRAVAYHTRANFEPKKGNELMARIAEKSGGRIGLSVVLDPILGAENLPGSGTLTERLQEMKPESVRVCPDLNRTVFTPIYWEEILNAVEALSLPLILDMEYSEGFFREFPAIAARYPRTKFVMIAYGLCRARHILPLLRHCPNLYITVEAMLDHKQIEECCALGFSGRLLFASNYPRISPAGALGFLYYAEVDENIRGKIACGNWEGIKG